MESQVVVSAPRSGLEAGQKIGEVAERSGLPVKTIRFYSDEGLIVPIGRSQGRYRLFGEEVYAELALIRTLKAMEIPLADGRRILEARRSGVCTCADLKATIAVKVGEIQAKLASLQELRTELTGLLHNWEDCGGQKHITPQPAGHETAVPAAGPQQHQAAVAAGRTDRQPQSSQALLNPEPIQHEP